MKFIITTEEEKQRLIGRMAKAVVSPERPWIVEAEFADHRTLPQNDMLHPTIREIARFMEANGAPKRPEWWWRYYFLAKFRGQDMCADPDPNNPGGLIVINKAGGTSSLSKHEASEFKEWLEAFGVEIGMERGKK